MFEPMQIGNGGGRESIMSETKLGQLIDANAGRDAIHVALAPMKAAEKLLPGEHVGFVDANDKTLAGSCDTPMVRGYCL